MRAAEVPVEGPWQGLPPTPGMAGHLTDRAEIAMAQPLRVGQGAPSEQVVPAVPQEQHPGPASLHLAEDLLVTGAPADEEGIGAEGGICPGVEAPEAFGLDGLHLQAHLLSHRPAVGPLVTLREAVEDEAVGPDAGPRSALRECRHR